MFQWLTARAPTRGQSIVLDLDETLLHTFVNGEKLLPQYRDAPELKPLLYEIDTRQGSFWGVKRPYLPEFLEYCSTRFRAEAIWSAGIESYVNAIEGILPLGRATVVTLNRNDCDLVPRSYTDVDGVVHHEEPTYCKPLDYLFEHYAPDFDRHTTWIVDDNPDYAKENLLNWIRIPRFEPRPDKLLGLEDDYLLRLIDWFEQPDVQTAPTVLELDKTWY